jgi:hypothetical protein
VVNRLQVAFGRKLAGIDFHAIDDKPVRFFFLIVAPPLEVSNQYLPVLGKLAQFAKRTPNGSRNLRRELLSLRRRQTRRRRRHDCRRHDATLRHTSTHDLYSGASHPSMVSALLTGANRRRRYCYNANSMMVSIMYDRAPSRNAGTPPATVPRRC